MGAMANWTDGPEYAPAERPDVFVAPDAAPLAPQGAGPAGGGPVPPPTGEPADAVDAAWSGVPDFATQPDAPPLDALAAAPEGPLRDPREAFDVVSTPLTTWGAAPGTLPGASATLPLGAPATLPSGTAAWPQPGAVPTGVDGYGMPAQQSAWGSAHAPQATRPAGQPWAPDQPFPPAQQPTGHVQAPHSGWPPPQINPPPFPQGAPPPWQVPPGPASGLQPVTLAQIVAAVTPGVLITLAVGGLVGALSFPLYLVASVLASRIGYRRTLLARAFSIGTFVVLGLGLLGVLYTYGTFDVMGWYDAASGWAQLANWVMALVTVLVVGDALRRGERPDEQRR